MIISSNDITLDAGGEIFLDAVSGLVNFYLNGSTTDYARIRVAANGATTLSTVDDGLGVAGHLTLDIDGDITLNSVTGNFIAKKGGTEFSATNSAYSGMILGYTRLEGDLSSQSTFEIQNTLTVEDDTHQISFKTPPSELVEIEAAFTINCQTTDTEIHVALSDQSATEGYNSVAAQFQYNSTGIFFTDDEIDDQVCVVKWVLSASHLEAVGVSNTFYIAFSTAGATKTAYVAYGLRASHGLAEHPFVIKATALPATIYDGT